MRAYLSGAMEFAKNEGANWREEMTLWLDEKLAHSVYNPVVESQSIMKEYGAENYREWKNSDSKKYANFVRVCVDRDINAVRNSVDYLICLWDESVFKGAGTHAEAPDEGRLVTCLGQVALGCVAHHFVHRLAHAPELGIQAAEQVVQVPVLTEPVIGVVSAGHLLLQYTT